MNTMTRVLTVGLVLWVASPLAAKQRVDPDLFRSEIARIELRKPTGWHFQTLQTVLKNRADVKFKDPEFGKIALQLANAPVMIATRHEEPFDQLNPSIHVMVRPVGTLEGRSGAEILTLVAPGLAAQFMDFAIVDSVRAIVVGQYSAARMTLRYTLKAQDGREFPTQATLVMIPRDAVLYQIRVSGPAEGPEVIGAEVDSVLASVRFLE